MLRDPSAVCDGLQAHSSPTVQNTKGCGPATCDSRLTKTLWLQCALVVLPCMHVSSRHAHDNWQRSAQAEFLGGPLRATQMEGGVLNRSAPEQLVR
jgi:hypothetical protein